jgi:hypothetical protein
MAVIGVRRQLRRPDYKRFLVFAIKARAEETLHRAETLLFNALLKFSLTQDTCFLGSFNVHYSSTLK